MTTRTIVTSQPDVACDVCERRLLRGEQADVFLATGRRLTVCELCAPRAVHEGWQRESEEQSLSLPPLRPRRGRSLLDRLAVQFRPRQRARPGTAEAARARADGRGYEAGLEEAGEPAPFDFLEPQPGTAAPAHAARAAAPGSDEIAGAGTSSAEPPSALELAVAAFNASEHPRRVAGVARSLGSPEVSVRAAEHAASVVRILVAWELCWYRYEVDLDEPETGARVAAQGTELDELSREERQGNAGADDAGRVSLSPA
ncbi:MAG TPA: hypothetical protein VGN08_04525 [Solirubrobacteraceae bacterium]|jgi:hypothetical protein